MISHSNHVRFLPISSQIWWNFMVLNMVPKLFQPHGQISVKTQLDLVKHIKIDKKSTTKYGVQQLKPWNLLI